MNTHTIVGDTILTTTSDNHHCIYQLTSVNNSTYFGRTETFRKLYRHVNSLCVRYDEHLRSYASHQNGTVEKRHVRSRYCTLARSCSHQYPTIHVITKTSSSDSPGTEAALISIRKPSANFEFITYEPLKNRNPKTHHAHKTGRARKRWTIPYKMMCIFEHGTPVVTNFGREADIKSAKKQYNILKAKVTLNSVKDFNCSTSLCCNIGTSKAIRHRLWTS